MQHTSPLKWCVVHVCAYCMQNVCMLRVSACVCVHACLHVCGKDVHCIYMHMYVFLCVICFVYLCCMCQCIFVCLCVCVYVCVYVCVCVWGGVHKYAF